jgi:hypothetical protein
MPPGHIFMIPFPTSPRTSSIRLDVDHSLLPRLSVAVMVAATSLIVFGLQVPQQPVLLTAGDDFRLGVDRYVALRQRIEGTMPTRRVTTDPAEILGRERALGAAIQAARPGARQGEIFSAAAVKDFSGIIAADLIGRSAGDQTALMTDVPLASPRVNEPYPAMSPLATFPALLLGALPRLPDDLEYRFMGRHLVIMDTKTNLIVDYLADVAPVRSEQ